MTCLFSLHPLLFELPGGSDGLLRRNHTLDPGTCTIVSPGAAIRCTTVPGVGANYTFVVAVDGGSSEPSRTLLSYSPPVISGVDGQGAVRAYSGGGVTLLLYGSNFGPEDNGSAVVAWATHPATEWLTFPAHDCFVAVNHTVIKCVTGEAVGTGLSWRVVVEGQSNALPLSSIGPPTIQVVRWADPNITVAATTGGTLLEVVGTNFGPSVVLTEAAWGSNNTGSGLLVAVELQVLAGSALLSGENCTLPTPHARLVCALPAGTGVITSVVLTVLGQAVQVQVQGLAYAVPAITGMQPPTWGTNLESLTVVLTGSGFGAPTQSSRVQVTLLGATGCGSGTPPGGDVVAVAGQAIVVRSDSELVFEVRTALAHVVPAWSLDVVVSGQSLSAPVVVRTRAPLVPTLTFDTAPNGTHHFLMMSGGEYGPGLSTCPGDVVVTVGNKPCITASMEKVGWVWILWVCALVGGWCGVVWSGLVWSGVVWCGVVHTRCCSCGAGVQFMSYNPRDIPHPPHHPSTPPPQLGPQVVRSPAMSCTLICLSCALWHGSRTPRCCASHRRAQGW
jgi:hypothetical protein